MNDEPKLTPSFIQQYGEPTIELLHCESEAKGLDEYFNNYEFHKDCYKALQVVDGEAGPSEWPELFKNFSTYDICFDDLDFHYERCYTCWRHMQINTMDKDDDRYKCLRNAMQWTSKRT